MPCHANHPSVECSGKWENDALCRGEEDQPHPAQMFIRQLMGSLAFVDAGAAPLLRLAFDTHRILPESSAADGGERIIDEVSHPQRKRAGWYCSQLLHYTVTWQCMTWRKDRMVGVMQVKQVFR